MKAGISLPRGQLRVEWNLTPRLRSTWGLLRASHSIKEFSFRNRQIIKSKTVATAVNVQGTQENWAYTKWRANSASTEESFSILTCWLARLTAWEELDQRQGRMHSLLQGLLTPRSQVSAQTCIHGQSVTGSREPTKSFIYINLKTQLLDS